MTIQMNDRSKCIKAVHGWAKRAFIDKTFIADDLIANAVLCLVVLKQLSDDQFPNLPPTENEMAGKNKTGPTYSGRFSAWLNRLTPEFKSIYGDDAVQKIDVLGQNGKRHHDHTGIKVVLAAEYQLFIKQKLIKLLKEQQNPGKH